MAADHMTKGVQPFLLVLQPQQRPGVALREAVFHQQAAAFRGEPQQPQLIGKGGGGTAQSGGGLLLRGAGAAEIGGDGGGLLQVVQVPALDIFDKGQQGGFVCLRLYPETGDA